MPSDEMASPTGRSRRRVVALEHKRVDLLLNIVERDRGIIVFRLEHDIQESRSPLVRRVAVRLEVRIALHYDTSRELMEFFDDYFLLAAVRRHVKDPVGP